jgi:uroporphyrinogen-III decarboxylase
VHMGSAITRVNAAFEHRLTGILPKGELWLGTELLKRAGLEDNTEGHLALVRCLKQDITCFPISHEPRVNKALGYRYFPVGALQKASEMGDRFLAALIDGPFQRLVEKKGLMKTLSGWVQEREGFLKAYGEEQRGVHNLLRRCLEQPVHAVIIADDMAGDAATFLDPRHIQDFSSSFYGGAVLEIREAHAYALFHSCGKITRLIPQLLSCGFDGLAGVQHRVNDLISLKEQYGTRLTFMAGIEADLLQAAEPPRSGLDEFRGLIHSLAPGGGLILSSCCGLYSGDFLERITELYEVADSSV